ncbi:MAG: hypothetical protein AB8B50_03805 [Pirellulaceae bacterium]
METTKLRDSRWSTLGWGAFLPFLLFFVAANTGWCRAPVFDVEVIVFDAKTGQRVSEFSVIPASFRENAEPTWQYQYIQKLSPNENHFTMKRGWSNMQLRIEADGYATQLSEPFKRDEVSQFQISLEQDAGITGEVVTADGDPAEKTTIAMCTRTQEVTVKNGIVRTTPGRGRSKTYSTRSDGSFVVPSEPCEWVLVFAHPNGYAERTKKELEASPIVELKPWGHLSGVVEIGGKPMGGIELLIGTGRGDVDVMLHYSAKATTDEDGCYGFAKLPPRKLSVSPVFRMDKVAHTPMHHMIDVKSGVKTVVNIPREGQRVIGKVSLPEELGLEREQLMLSAKCFLRPPSVSGPQQMVKQSFKVYNDFLNTEAGKAYQRDSIQVGDDGTFSIEGLPEARFVIQVFAHEKGKTTNDDRPVAFTARRIEVQPETVENPVLDLGEFPLRSNN